MAPARSKAAAPKPVPQATLYAQREQRLALMRLGAALAPMLLFVIPALPSPVGGVDWKASLWRGLRPQLMAPFPPADTVPFPPQPVLQWLSWGLAAGGAFLALSLLQHLMSLYLQRTRPLAGDRTYLRLRTPLNVALKPEDGRTLLTTLHGVLPPSDLRRGDGAPFALRWTGRPERAVLQGVSVLGPETLVTSIQKTLQGLSRGTEVDVQNDPLLAELKPGRYVCWSEVRLAGPYALALAIPSGSSPLLDALLPTLSPLGGCFVGDVQVIMRPVNDRAWRTTVLSMLESLKVDAGSTERRVMELKAAGPAFDVHVRLVVVAASPQAGQTMVQTMGAALASSAQSVASATQRLLAGPVQVLPAVIESPPPFPAARAKVGWIAGLLLATAATAGIWFASRLPLPLHLGLAVWALPLPVACLPHLILGARWRKRTRAGDPARLQTVLKSVMPLRNPRVVPVWSEWLGHLP